MRQQYDFRRAADIVTDVLMVFEEVEAIAVIGSVAKPLWKEVPRFSRFRPQPVTQPCTGGEWVVCGPR